jgi:phosphoribosylformimino-5-aminoimidazole carboxamide ribotide isomerase
VLGEHGDRVVVSIDALGGRLAAEGWTEQTDIPDQSVVAHFGARGVRRFIYSSVERDGMLRGPDLDGARRIASVVRGSFIYSGGVSSLDDLRALAALRQVNLAGVIVGKALYERRFSVEEGQRALEAA